LCVCLCTFVCVCICVYARVLMCARALLCVLNSGRQLHFADSRNKTVGMIQTWISEGVRLGVNLGNLVDKRSGIQRKHQLAMQTIKGVLCDDYKCGTWRFRMADHHHENKFRADILHCFGEHDLQHFSLEELVALFNLPTARHEPDCLYYSTSCASGWRFLFLDTNDISPRSRSLLHLPSICQMCV